MKRAFRRVLTHASVRWWKSGRKFTVQQNRNSGVSNYNTKFVFFSFLAHPTMSEWSGLSESPRRCHCCHRQHHTDPHLLNKSTKSLIQRPCSFFSTSKPRKTRAERHRSQGPHKLQTKVIKWGPRRPLRGVQHNYFETHDNSDQKKNKLF